VSFDVGRELRFVWTPDGAEFETLIIVEPDERGFAAVQV
jgi:hypothetical protein